MGLLGCCLSDEDKTKITHTVWLDIALRKPPHSEAIGRIEIGLFGNLVPRTVKNFIKLSEEKEAGKGYKGSCFHRIEKEILIQGGDFTEGTGRGGRSIYGETFKDENFKLKHSKAGIVSMANLGRKNTNGSQFFITLKQMPIFDNQHVAFGQVVVGMDVVHKIECVDTYGNSPTVEVIITSCGLKTSN